ncbi:MAG: hypothetical protein SCK29_02595 [Bacillota bacterium]|nr:hypothetical protein [Bacillota bacterium]MDW7682990.1 hypothetical protein [Bacillota bacterium]
MHISRHGGKQKSAAAEYNRQGAAAMLRGANREATFYLLSAVVCDPDFWPAFFNLGNCWARLGENEAAIWAYEQAVRNCEDHAPLFLNLGILQCRAGKAKQALPYLEQAWRLNPNGANQCAALGYACYHLGELGLSWHWYKNAAQLAPDNEAFRESTQFIGKKISVSGH